MVYRFNNEIHSNSGSVKHKKTISKLSEFRNGFPPNTIPVEYYYKYLLLKHPV